MGTSIEHQVSVIWGDIKNQSRNEEIKITPPPPGYIPPKPASFYRKFKKRTKLLPEII